MLPHYGGLIGVYMWEKEMERLERYKDRPWELQSRESSSNPWLVWLFVGLGIMVGLMFFSVF